MPYPPLDHPDRCPASDELAPAAEPDAIWVRCPRCGRLIARRANGLFFPHLNHPTRRNDAIQESLTAHGYNRRDRVVAVAYAEPEAD